MANTLRLKRSAVAGKVPATSDLELGELAINTHDGTLFLKKDDGTPAIVQLGAASGAGTVTSVGLSLPAIFAVSGSPVTTSGTLTASLSAQSAKSFLAAPNASSGTPSFRAILASDIPTLNQNTTGTAANVTGTVALGNGGTGATTAAGARSALAVLGTAGGTMTGVLLLDNTTSVAAPPLAFDGDSNTGIGHPAADTLSFSTAGIERARFLGNGEFVLGRTGPYDFQTSNTPGHILEPAGGGALSRNNGAPLVLKRYGGTGDLLYWLYGTSVLASVSTNGTSVSYNTGSDYRLKDVIGPTEGASARLRLIRVVDFTWKANPALGVDTGVLAHELAQVLPFAVNGAKDAVDAEGRIQAQGVDYGKLTPLLVAALQEALGRIDALETRVAALEGG